MNVIKTRSLARGGNEGDGHISMGIEKYIFDYIVNSHVWE